MKKINKKYDEIMRQADNAVGRKEVVSLLKKAATIIANIYDPLLGITYAFGNILTLTFLSWLYKETWNYPRK